MTEVTPERTHVVVVGAGYAGTLAANHLRQRSDIDITVINPRSVFVERIRLHQLVADTGTATADYATLLGEGIQLIVDSVDVIETDRRRVLLNSGIELDYDYLIYAVGSTGATASMVPGYADYAHSVADLESAQRLHYALTDLPLPAPVTVVGGGLTGIETASELAEGGRSVTLVCGPVLGPSLSRRGRRSVAKRLRRLGVNVLESVAVAEVRWDEVVLTDGVVLPSAATIWTAGFAVPQLAARSGLHTDPMGAQAANTVLSRIAGDAPAALSQAFVGQCISLGRTHATFQMARTDEGALGRGGAHRRCGAAQCGDNLDGRVRGAAAGRAQRPAHRPDGPAAHRRDAHQHRRRAHRRRG